MLAHRLCTDFQYFSSIHNKMIHLFAFLVQYHTIQKLLLFIKDALLTSLRPVPLKNRKSMSSPAPQKLTKPVGPTAWGATRQSWSPIQEEITASLVLEVGKWGRAFHLDFCTAFDYPACKLQKDKFKCDVFLDHKVVFQPSPRPTHPWYLYLYNLYNIDMWIYLVERHIESISFCQWNTKQ